MEQQQQQVVEISLKDVGHALAVGWKAILIVTIIVVILTAGYFYYFVPDEYTARTSLYVLNQQSEENITSSDLSSSIQLVNDYRELILSYKVKSSVCERLGIDDLKGYDITVSAVNDTRIIEISVTGHNAKNVTAIANWLAAEFSEKVVDIMRVDNVSIIDEAVVPDEPSGPPRARNTAIAGVIAFVVMFIIVLVVVISNKTLKSAAEIEAQLDLPVLAQVSLIDGQKLPKSKGGRR